MNRCYRFSIFALSVIFLVACGSSDPGGGGNPVTPPPGPGPDLTQGPKYTWIMFAAPWCGPCLKELPLAQKEHDEKFAKYGERVKVEVYIQTGQAQHQNPSQQIADEMASKLNLKFKMIPDLDPEKSFPIWKQYRRYFATGYALPTAVVLDEEGKVLKKFKPISGMKPDETVAKMVNFIQSKIEESQQ